MSQTAAAPYKGTTTAMPVLWAVSLCHCLNDMMQVLLPAIFPILKGGFDLNFAQIGLLSLTYQITASLLQPVIGTYTDARPQPFSLPIGMGFTMIGLITIAYAPSYGLLLAGAALLGIGSSIFHPESARIARLASGGKHGFAQSVFQVGGNFGQATGPLLAAFFILPRGRSSLAWFAFVALTGMIILGMLGQWYRANGMTRPAKRKATTATHALSNKHVAMVLSVLILLMFSKYFYLVSITNYYIFYLMHHFGVSTQSAQVDLFYFLGASAVGVFFGGPLSDRFGRKSVIWGSIFGIVPFTLALPYVGLNTTIILTIVIGLILSSAFSTIVVYAQELLPGRVGMVSGLFFGMAFGLAGLGAALLGLLADWRGIDFVYRVCAFLPLIGALAVFLPDLGKEVRKAHR